MKKVLQKAMKEVWAAGLIAGGCVVDVAITTDDDEADIDPEEMANDGCGIEPVAGDDGEALDSGLGNVEDITSGAAELDAMQNIDAEF